MQYTCRCNRKRIDLGTHPPARLAGNKIMLGWGFFMLKINKNEDLYKPSFKITLFVVFGITLFVFILECFVLQLKTLFVAKFFVHLIVFFCTLIP